MSLPFEQIPNELRINGEKYADSQASYELLNDMTKVIKAKLMNESDEKSEAGKERIAFAHPDYETHLKAVKTARHESLKLKAYISSLESLFELYRSLNATARSEMKM